MMLQTQSAGAPAQRRAKGAASVYAYRFGVNYTPSQNWWYCWNDFDADSIARDLDAIAGLEADHIRIMALWTFFQPNPAWVSPAHLERLEKLMSLADERNLDVCVSMLNGHLTGQNFRQGYEKNHSFFSSPEMRATQKLYFKQVAGVVKAHENFLGFDLGNELNCCWNTADLREGDAWFKDMIAYAEALAPNRVHVNGVDHAPWFAKDTFSPAELAALQKIVALHCWIYFTGALERGGALDPPAVHLIDAMAALARAYAGTAGKPVWAQEYGASEQWMPRKTIPVFLERTMRNAIHGGVTWFSCWASHDIQPKFKVNPLEYTLGLITCGQKIKPQGEVFRSLAREFRGTRLTPEALAAIPSMKPPETRNRNSTWKWLLRWIDRAT